MKTSFLAQLGTLVNLLNEVSNYLEKEIKNIDRKQYSLESEIDFLEFSIRKHLTKKHISSKHQEYIVKFIHQSLNNSHIESLITDEDKT